jgi:hypothetical protein
MRVTQILEFGDSSGHPFHGNQWTGSGSMQENATQFSSSGGEIHELAGPDEARAYLDELDNMGEFMPEEWKADPGTVMTYAALNEAVDEGIAHVFIAGNPDSGIAGALAVGDTTDLTDRPSAFVSFLGTTGLEEGAGSALVQQAAQWAAGHDLPLVGDPVAKAVGFWQKMGWHEDPENTGESIWGWTKSETKQVASG